MRLVILEFEDDKAAERFIEHMRNRTGPTAFNATALALAHADVTHLFAKPTKFCKCQNPKNFIKTKRFGWRIHEACKKPRPLSGVGFRTFLFDAHNLLDELRKKKDEDAP